MWSSHKPVRKSQSVLVSYNNVENNQNLSDILTKKSLNITSKEQLNIKSLKSYTTQCKTDKNKYIEDKCKEDKQKNKLCLNKNKSRYLSVKFSKLKKKIQYYIFPKANKLLLENIEKQNNNLNIEPRTTYSLPLSSEVIYESDTTVEEFEDNEEEMCYCKEITRSENNTQIISSGYCTPVGIWTPISYKKYNGCQKTLTKETCDSITGSAVCDCNNNNNFLSHSSVSQRHAGVSMEHGISTLLDEVSGINDEQIMNKLKAGQELYPNCDTSVWMRSCEKEVVEPIKGYTTGFIPKWLKGTLLRNGPGGLKVGEMTFEHLFDSSALLHREISVSDTDEDRNGAIENILPQFGIDNGEVTYQCRYLKSSTFQKNHAANRIVVSEFGTKSMPDPCKTIFQRVNAIFTPGETLSDNANISVYPFGDEFYAFTESSVIHRIDPVSLDTLEKVNVSKHVGIVNHTSHPHIMNDGTVFNQGMSVQPAGPSYSIVKFPMTKTQEMTDTCKINFCKAEVMASIKARWPLHPSYMHTFGITENYFIIVEQPLSISVPTMIKCQLRNDPFISVFRFYRDKNTLIHAVNRNTGKHKTFATEAFFYLHIINQYEEENHLVIDICCYSDPSMLDCMYIEALKNINKNPNYARMFRARPLRFVLPLGKDYSGINAKTNLNTLPYSNSKAYKCGKVITVTPELLCNMGCETPRINYFSNLGKPYRYFYAISSDVDLENPGTLIKVDTWNGNSWTWCETGVFPSEPVFVPTPDSQREDDGVILSALVWGKALEKQAGLIVLDARDWKEIGRTVFQTPGPVPKCLHGWFTPDH